MKKLIGLLFFAAMAIGAATAQNAAINGFCTTGGVKVSTSGSMSSTTVQASYPKCLVSVYLTGTTTLASIFSDTAGTPLANPFTANANASWLFYSALGNPLDIVMSGGTPNAFPAPVTLVGVISGTSGVITSVNTLIGAVTLSQGSNITITPIGGNALQISSTGGGGGNPDGLGTAQSSTKTGSGFLNGGTINTDAEKLANNGPQLTQINLCASGSTNTICSMFTPPTSTDTSIGQPLPVLAGKPSSAWQDLRNNSFANWLTNPIPAQTGLSLFPLQTPSQVAFPSAVAYTTPFPPGYSTPDFPTGLFEGSQQNGAIYAHSFCCGYSLGNLDALAPAPQPGYPAAAPWSGFGGDTHLDQFFGTGIRQASTWLTNFFGTGDAQTNAWFCIYAGGAISVSDEGIHCLGSIHASTPGDTVGTVTSVIDSGATTGLMKIRLNITTNAKQQGQGRFMYGTPVFTTFADKITNAAPDSQTPGTIVLNDITLPISTAWGFMTNKCDPLVQDIGVGIGTNSGVAGCAVTVQHGTFNTTDKVCTAFNVGGLWNFGSVVTAVTSLSGGQQTLTMWMHKPAPATAVVYQGGTCGMGVHWIADDAFGENAGNTPVSGSVLPSIGSPDTHTMLMPIAIIASSHGGTREIVNDFGGPTPGPHAEGFNVDLTRSSNIVHGLLEQGSFLPSQFWFDQLFFQVANCSDSSFNGQIGSLAGMPGPTSLNIQWAQTGADSAGCTGAKIYPITAQVAIVQMAEIYSVSDPAVDGSVSAANTVNGYIAAGVNPYFLTPGNSATIPTHPVAGGDVLNLNAQFTQPMIGITGLNIIQQYNSMEGNSVGLQITTFNKLEAQFGSGGNATPETAILIHAPTGFPVLYALRTDFSPHFLGAGIKFGPCPGYWDTANDTFCNYAMISASGTQGEDTLAIVDKPRQDTIAFHLKKDATDDISFSRIQSKFNVPTAFNAFQVESNVGGVFGGNFIPTQALSQCTTVEPNGTSAGPGPCWRRITTSIGSAAPTSPGAPTTNRVIYLMVGHDAYGLFASGEYVVDLSPSPITPTFSNTINCKDLPAGVTGTQIYLLQPGIDMLPVTGPGCTAPTDTVIDTGVYDTPVGPLPDIAGIVFPTGAVQVNAILFNQADHFGTSTPANTVTSGITQLAAGILRFNTTDNTIGAGNGLGSLQAMSYGTGTATNRDSAGEVTLTTGSGTFSFTGTYTSRPECSIHDHTTPANDHTNTFSVTNTAITITGSGSDVVGFACTFRN